MPKAKITEGVFAINKPKGISSAQVLRELQYNFNPSQLFAPWLDAERTSRKAIDWRERKKRKDKRLQVKLGHGGTLDPAATGVLIVGVGRGTKELQGFLECTKAYEATILFGVSTDTYDVLGKVVLRASHSHITRDSVERALEKFRGPIMQRPPLYSALRIQGKRLYEYAREGKEVPVEIVERPVEVKELEMIEWLPSGSHKYKWPTTEAGKEETGDRGVIEKVFHFGGSHSTASAATSAEPRDQTSDAANGTKRKRPEQEDDHLVSDKMPPSKRQEDDPQLCMSGGLQSPDRTDAKGDPVAVEDGIDVEQDTVPISPSNVADEESSPIPETDAPAVILRMTVTSGFYVRSLSHDLGVEVGSLGIMSELVRTKQADFELGRNVLEYDDLSKGEEVWGPKVERMLDEWQGERYWTDEEQTVHEDRSKSEALGGEQSVSVGRKPDAEET